jgi:hypothetical protein
LVAERVDTDRLLLGDSNPTIASAFELLALLGNPLAALPPAARVHRDRRRLASLTRGEHQAMGVAALDAELGVGFGMQSDRFGSQIKEGRAPQTRL